MSHRFLCIFLLLLKILRKFLQQKRYHRDVIELKSLYLESIGHVKYLARNLRESSISIGSMPDFPTSFDP